MARSDVGQKTMGTEINIWNLSRGNEWFYFLKAAVRDWTNYILFLKVVVGGRGSIVSPADVFDKERWLSVSEMKRFWFIGDGEMCNAREWFQLFILFFEREMGSSSARWRLRNGILLKSDAVSIAGDWKCRKYDLRWFDFYCVSVVKYFCVCVAYECWFFL